MRNVRDVRLVLILPYTSFKVSDSFHGNARWRWAGGGGGWGEGGGERECW